MFTATHFQGATYLLGVCLFSISFLVFLNSSVSFVITDLIKERNGVGNAVGTLGFADELVALVACPVWGALSDRIGVRTVCITHPWGPTILITSKVCVLGYSIVGIALFVFVQARNVFPQLLLARLFFSIGAAATATMVTAILPSMTAIELNGKGDARAYGPRPANGHMDAPSVSSELAIIPARLRDQAPQKPAEEEKGTQVSSTRLAGIVGMFTGCGALIALGLFLPLPTQFRNFGLSAAQALTDTFYVVGAIAFLAALLCHVGLRRMKGEEGKSWRTAFLYRPEHSIKDGNAALPYHSLMITSVRLGLKNQLIGLGYLGGFVARASSVGISLFIPLYVNHYFISSGICKIDDPLEARVQCQEAYVLAAKLTGTSQLVALLFAPVFGYLADRYRRFHVPLLAASLSGIIGYLGFANLKSPEAQGGSGSPLVYLIVALLGVSQIGCIVCSLGLLSRGISGLEDMNNPAASSVLMQNTQDAGLDDPVDTRNSTTTDTPNPTIHPEGNNDGDHESTRLLRHQGSRDLSRNHLKGSIAGIYSLGGGAGILLLTKLGGFLFDTKSPASPFYMLSLFNLVLLAVGAICGALEIVRLRQRS